MPPRLIQLLLIPKKYRFAISSFLLSIGLIVVQMVDSSLKFPAIALLVILTGLFSIWAMYEGLGKNMTWLSLILPMLFTLGVGIFWFLLPVGVYARIPIVILFSVGIYVLISTMNIYNVSSSLKTIALLRAARGVGFVLTLLISFLLFDAILSIRQAFYVNFTLVTFASFLMFLPGYWSINLQDKFDSTVFIMSIVSAVIMGELSTLIFFWPVTVVVGSLFLTSGVYLMLGLGQAKLEDRLFPSVSREYLSLGLIVLLGMFFATRWGG